ncbi:3119_t:CDS:2, partial [Gigaspora rosea]
STIGHLLKNKNDVENNLSAKKQRTVQYQDLENTLLELNIPEGDLKFSYSRLFKFKRRHSFEQIMKHGEDASVDKNVIATAIPKLRESWEIMI